MPRINDLPHPEGPRRTERTETQRSDGAERTPKRAVTAAPADRVEVSADARQVQDLQKDLTDAARELPEIREDRVALARARIEEGHYDSEQVRRTVADRLLSLFGL